METVTPIYQVKFQHDSSVPVFEGHVLDVVQEDDQKRRRFTRIEGYPKEVPTTNQRMIFSYCIGLCDTRKGGWVEMRTLKGDLLYEHRVKTK